MLCMEKDNQLIWRYNGETLVICPWGENSLRIRSATMGDIEDTDYALIEQCEINAEIEIGEKQSTIINGKVKAVIEDNDWEPTGKISFYNQKGELLLRETGFQGH